MENTVPYPDRRQVQRHRVLRAARVFIAEGYSSLDCTVRDESEQGARLRFPSTDGIPEEFPLQINERQPRVCKVVWRTETEIGVAYNDPALLA